MRLKEIKELGWPNGMFADIFNERSIELPSDIEQRIEVALSGDGDGKKTIFYHRYRDFMSNSAIAEKYNVDTARIRSYLDKAVRYIKRKNKFWL